MTESATKNFKDHMTSVSEAWRALNPEEKAVWNAKAKEQSGNLDYEVREHIGQPRIDHQIKPHTFRRRSRRARRKPRRRRRR